MEAFRTGGTGAVSGLAARRLAELYATWRRRVRFATRRALEFGVRPHLLRGRVTHVHGPGQPAYGPHELLVITVVRNGALYVRSFMEHYRAIGVAHCVFLDNGSTDDTVERLCAHAGVTVLRTDAPYDRYENTMKRYLAERFSRGRWNLCADIDELFDYPSADDLPLSGFLAYLDQRGFTAVVAQLLDMFPDMPLADLQSTPDDRVAEKHGWYDTSAVERCPYEWSGNANPAIRMHWGGIRRAVFGTDNGLTKAALVRMDGRVKPFVEWHQATGGVIADVSCVLRHYPFVSAFRDKVLDAVRTGRYGATTTGEYIAYAKVLGQSPRVALKRETARRFTGLEALIEEGFVVVSEEYRAWVRAQSSGPPPADARQEPVRR